MKPNRVLTYLYISQRRCLRIFLIGTGDLKSIPLQVCFTASMVPMLKVDMKKKLEKLGIDIEILMEEPLRAGGASAVTERDPESTQDDAAAGASGFDDTDSSPGFTYGSTGTGMDNTDDVDADGIPDVENPEQEIDELNENDSGFGLDGKAVIFTSNKFWNYVDYILDVLRETARKGTSAKEEFEKEVTR